MNWYLTENKTVVTKLNSVLKKKWGDLHVDLLVEEESKSEGTISLSSVHSPSLMRPL